MMLCGNRPLQTAGSSTDLPYDSGLRKTNSNSTTATTRAQRQAAARTAAAKSKSKLWGPSHSFDSESDDDSAFGKLGASPRPSAANNGGAGYNWWETVNKAWTELSTQVVHQMNTTGNSTMEGLSSSWSNTTVKRNRSQLSKSGLLHKGPMEVVPEEDVEQEGEEDSTDPSTQEDSQEQRQQEANRSQTNLSHSLNHSHSTTAHANTTISRNNNNMSTCTTTGRTRSSSQWNNTSRDNSSASYDDHDEPTPQNKSAETVMAEKVEAWTDLFHNACGASPCSAQDLEELFGKQQHQQQRHNKKQSASSSNAAAASKNQKPSERGLGIAPLKLDLDDDGVEEDDILLNTCTSPPAKKQQQQQQQAPERTLSEESPAERRRQRAAVRRQRHEDAARSVTAQSVESHQQQQQHQQQQHHQPHEDFEVTSQQGVVVTQPEIPPPPPEPTHHPEDEVLHYPLGSQQQQQPLQPEAPLPLETLLVKEDEAQALERSISELTMRSSYQGEITTRRPTAAPDQRRMAYYAVGRHHRLNSGPRSGGNRRCYFTGKLIFGGGTPFYAGIVQQGLRTLVVFCLPSALGMPHNLPAYQAAAPHKRRPSLSASAGTASSIRTGLLQRSRRTLSSASAASTALSKSPSKLSSTINLDDMSLSIEGDIDPNWNLDKDFLLSILPEPSDEVLAEMNQRYPEQFETLPVQVRHASCWRLFVKFCFFSGLPIAEGELHYQVRPKLALEMYGEEIVLSHDVMEAVNGASSAEILKLPNRKTFRYLNKHYPQQSQKLPEVVFQRTSWEQVKAEV